MPQTVHRFFVSAHFSITKGPNGFSSMFIDRFEPVMHEGHLKELEQAFRDTISYEATDQQSGALLVQKPPMAVVIIQLQKLGEFELSDEQLAAIQQTKAPS